MKKKFFRRLLYNWHVKLISLVLAFILWKYVDTLQETEKFFSIHLDVKGMPKGFGIVNEIPKSIKVVVRGKEENISLLSPNDIIAYIDLQNQRTRERRLPVKVKKLNIPRGVKIKEITPHLVTIVIEEVLHREVPVVPVFVGKPMRGFTFQDFIVTPQTVVISGVKSSVTNITELYTEEISLTHLTETTIKEVSLVIPEKKIRASMKAVQVKVIVSEKYTTRRFSELPVKFSNLSEQLHVKGDTTYTASVTLSVPELIKSTIDPSEIMIYAECGGVDAPGNYVLPLHVQIPLQGVKVLKVEPITLLVHFEKRED